MNFKALRVNSQMKPKDMLKAKKEAWQSFKFEKIDLATTRDEENKTTTVYKKNGDVLAVWSDKVFKGQTLEQVINKYFPNVNFVKPS